MPDALRGCVPTAAQRLLLQAALLDAPAAARAWREWYAGYGLEAPDEGSFRLLPLVFRNLERTGGGPWPEWEKLRGIHRLAWSRNLWLFHQVRPMAKELKDAGIPVMLLKGAALALRVYPDAGARPMQDVDLMVPAARAADAFAILERRHCRPKRWRPPEIGPEFYSFCHAMDFESRSGARVDLHWHAFIQCCHTAADEPFWTGAAPFDFLGIEVLAPAATEHLLQLCVHGIVRSPTPSVRWVADSLLLLRAETVDWARLAGLACRLDVAPYLAAALNYLRSEWNAPVPDATLRALADAPNGAGTREEFEREVAPLAQRSAWTDLLTFWARWRRSLGGASPWLRLPAFARHLQYAFELDRMRMLPAQFARSAWRRMGAPQ
ncbi:MAG: nucleotidyltransferase family protein [Bryobacteraceae bacterium]